MKKLFAWLLIICILAAFSIEGASAVSRRQIYVDNMQITVYYTGGASTGTLIVNATTGGSATGSNSTFTPPANLTINATPTTGYLFSNWSTTCNGTVANATSQNTQIEVDDTVACFAQANFEQVATMLPAKVWFYSGFKLLFGGTRVWFFS